VLGGGPRPPTHDHRASGADLGRDGQQVASLARELLAEEPTVAVVGPLDDEDALAASVRG
jgi:hypothetical protein